MKRKLLLPLFMLLTSLGLEAQVTQINSNKSLLFESPISNTKAIFVSDIDSTLWVTDGILTGTIQLSTVIKFIGSLGSIAFLDGKLIFAGKTAATGTEVYITDGTPGGTILLNDINPGPLGSTPDADAVVLNGFIYFTAERPAEGRELWRTDGTPGGTTLVKDIFAGVLGSNAPNKYNLFSSGSYLLFAAKTPSSGIELWRSDGTDAGTVILKDINTGNSGADSSNPGSFYMLNSTVLFVATDATHGEEIWRTDGTVPGTSLLKDINPGTGSSTSIPLFPGFSFPVFLFFHTFNNKAFFSAYDGTSTAEVWSTDGTDINTSLLKDLTPYSTQPFVLLVDAVNLPGKFIFPVSDDLSGYNALWESDGTPGNTKEFKTFDSSAFLFPNYNFGSLSLTQQLFQGNKFFFIAGTIANGYELWISDGTDGSPAHTQMVKDISPGTPNGMDPSMVSYIYTSAALYFPATNGINGLELWKSDGTSGGTTMVADIITGLDSSKPNISFFLINNKIVFEATNGDDPILTDLYAVDGTFTPLPVSITDFTVMPKSPDALLNWHTSQEINSKNFTIQRSVDGVDFKSIGIVTAAGTSAVRQAYSFTDVGVMNSGNKTLYYRLLVTDIDGKSAVSQVITLKLKNTGEWNVRLMTNPVSESIKLLFSGVVQNVQVTIVDMGGKKLYSSSLNAINGQITMPADNLPRGRYVLLFETGNERKTIQFVK